MIRRRLAESSRTVAAVFSNPGLRRLELGRVAATVSATGTAVTFVVLAYNAGGAEAVAALVVVTTWAAAVLSPAASIVADRYQRSHVIVAADAIRVGLLLATAAMAVDGPTWLIVVLASIVTIIGTASSSARAALSPVLARSSDELVAANAVAGTTANLASLVGPAAAGIAVAFGGESAALAVFAAASAASAIAARGIVAAPGEGAPRGERVSTAEALAGFRAMVGSRGVRVVVGMAAAETFIGGVLAVLLVVAVVENLGFGETGPSFLAGALSAGALLGSVVLLLLGPRRLGQTMATGVAMWGLSAALLGLSPVPVVGVALLVLVGLGDALADLTALTIVQRLIPNDVLARALGALRALFYVLASLGSLAAPLLLDLVGFRTALVVAGLLLPAATVGLWPLLAHAGAAPAGASVGLLRSVPFFSLLPAATIERLAAVARPLDVEEGSVIVREGEDDRGFYVVADGEVEVEAGGRVVAKSGGGGYFGEIASLRDSPRTATVRASAPTKLLFIPGDEFLDSLSSDEAVYSAAERVVTARLARAV